MRLLLIGATLVLAAGCTTTPYDFPSPLVTPAGKKGFGMTGYVSYTPDEAKARGVILVRMRAACGGEADLIRLDLQRADSVIGVKHLHYDAVAECR